MVTELLLEKQELTRCSPFFASPDPFWCGKCKKPARVSEADDPKRVIDGGRRSSYPPEWVWREKKGSIELK